MGLFLAVAALGGLFFLVSLVFGDHGFDHDHDVGHPDPDHGGSTGPSLLSIFTVSWFMVGFGAAGAISRSETFNAGMPISTIVGSATGAALWGLAFLFMVFLHKQQADSTVTTAKLVGSTGTIVLPISQDGVGKMQCRISGSVHELIVRSSDGSAIPAGVPVKILEDQGGVFVVERHFKVAQQ